MKKRLSSGLLALCMMLTLLPVTAFAEGGTIIASGKFGAQGDNLTWTLDSEGTLTISGEGMMGNEGSVPWTKSDIKKVVIEDGVTSIGYDTFANCSSLTTISIPRSVTSIGAYAFYSSGLTNLAIPSGVISIDQYAFWGCTRLSKVEIPSSVTSIANDAFYGCSSLSSIAIPSSVTSIGSNTFANCSSLSKIDVDSNNPSYASLDGVLYNKDLTRLIQYPAGKSGASYEIPESANTIGSYAFYGCPSLTSMTIPESVTSIKSNAFRDCSNLASITILGQITAIEMFTFDNCKKLSNVILPNSITSIGDSAFRHCSSLTSLPALDNVTDFGGEAFAYCDGLTNVTIPEGVTSITGAYVFGWCQNLTSAVISPNMKEIPHGLFQTCKKLASVTIPSSVTTVRLYAFAAVSDSLEVYYSGTRAQWNKINVMNEHDGNQPLLNATIHCIDDPFTVTYDPNGGTGTMADTLVGPFDAYTLPACGFTAPAGKEFKAWQIGGQEYAPGSTYTVTANTTVTAVWQTIPPVEYMLTGTIIGHKGVTYTSVTAQLVGLNGSIYSAKVNDGVPDNTGKTKYAYTVSAPAGQYNLEVEARTNEGGVVNRTAVVKLTGNGQTKDVNLPNGQAKVEVKNETGTAAFVGGLDELIIDADGNVNGEAAMTIRNVENSDPGVLAIRNAAPGQTLEFMEFSISKTVDGTTTEVTDTGDVTIEIVLAFDRTGKSNIAVYRFHDGSVDTLTTQASNNGEKFEVDDESIAIYAKKFSVYAIGYTAAITNPTTPSRPSSSSDSDGGSSSPNYSITTPTRITGGTVKVNPTSAGEGQRVTITVKPNAGYELATLTVTDSKGNIVTVTDQGDGKYTFTMPKSKVSIDVSFKAIGSATQINFTDVQSSAYYYDAVVWAVENGVTFGITNTAFGPDTACTRAQIVSFLWHQAGSPKMSGTNPFTDVSSTDYYYDAVLWAVENSITFGSTDTTFSPGTTCTRAQAMTFLYRGKKSPAVSGTGGFTDVSTDAYYTDAVQWAVANGVTYGTTATTFSPDQDCTRAQIVTFIYNAREK